MWWIPPVGSNTSATDPKAEAFAKYLENFENLFFPAVVVYEVYKKLYREQTIIVADRFLSTAEALEWKHPGPALMLSLSGGFSARIKLAFSEYATTNAAANGRDVCNARRGQTRYSDNEPLPQPGAHAKKVMGHAAQRSDRRSQKS